MQQEDLQMHQKLLSLILLIGMPLSAAASNMQALFRTSPWTLTIAPTHNSVSEKVALLNLSYQSDRIVGSIRYTQTHGMVTGHLQQEVIALEVPSPDGQLNLYGRLQGTYFAGNVSRAGRGCGTFTLTNASSFPKAVKVVSEKSSWNLRWTTYLADIGPKRGDKNSVAPRIYLTKTGSKLEGNANYTFDWCGTGPVHYEAATISGDWRDNGYIHLALNGLYGLAGHYDTSTGKIVGTQTGTGRDFEMTRF
jgi:hypothetical protein